MEAIWSLVLVYAVFVGALMSPGPDMLITMRNALGYSARAGVFTAAGIAAALIIHMGYCIAGIGVIISQSILLFTVIKFIGAAYLIYMGAQALRSTGTALKADALTENLHAETKSDKTAFMNGFVTNAFNPKAMMFFLALFSQMLDPDLSLTLTMVFCAGCILTAFFWFSLLSFVMASKPARSGYSRASKWIDRVFGCVFVGLGLKLVLTKAT